MQVVERAGRISPGCAEALLHEQLLKSPTAANSNSLQVVLPPRRITKSNHNLG